MNTSETQGKAPCPGPTQPVGGKCKGPPGTWPLCYQPLPLYLCFPSTLCHLFQLPPSMNTHFESSAGADRQSDIFTVTLFSPFLQMESVGMYGLCGCAAKSKMKCDSRWEIPASGRKGMNLCKYQTGVGSRYTPQISFLWRGTRYISSWYS